MNSHSTNLLDFGGKSMARGGCCGTSAANGGTSSITLTSMFVPSFDLIAQEQSANSSYGGVYKGRQSYNSHMGKGFSPIYQSQTPQGYQRSLEGKINYNTANTANYNTRTVAEKVSAQVSAQYNTTRNDQYVHNNI